MKLITLNIWGGRIQNDLISFLGTHAETTDIFMFQEVYNGTELLENDRGIITNEFSTIAHTLSQFTGYHSEAFEDDIHGKKVPYGISIFVRKDITVLSHGTHEIFQMNEQVALAPGVKLWNRLLQYISIPYKDSTLTIYNLHGLYTGGGKDDEPGRILQSQRVKEKMHLKSGEKILCGDFNLNPETQSFALLKEGLRDLIAENNITSTRSHHYTKEQKFADYILTTPAIDVKNFQVLQDVVSDHLPLVLEFE